MKSILYSFIVALSLLIIQCTNEIPTTNDPINLELGKVSLKIDKANAPAEVVLVEAFLTREGHDTLYGNLNLISSTSADILFKDVAAGEWHLKVDAKDSSGVVLYTGETNINILAGVLTQVNLTLVATGFGTGSIYIYVNWGQNVSWVDYPGNPVLSGQNSAYNNCGIAQPVIIKDGNIFKMWYVGDACSAVHYVLYAESEDGINWTHPHSGPVLSPGPQGTWDSWAVHPGAVIKENGIYKMYYSGFSNKYDPWHIGLATSSNGIDWIKNPGPVFMGGTGDDYQVFTASIIKIEDTYHMYYSGGYYHPNGSTSRINLATSGDGISWTRYSGNPIITSTNTWEGTGVRYSSVIKDNDIYRMVYMGIDLNGFGFATSIDGLNWTISQSNPFFRTENTSNNWGSGEIAFPGFVKASNNELRIYYNGSSDYSHIFKIGFIKKIQ